MDTQKLDQLFLFLKEINGFKSVYRLSYVEPDGRRESDAEHTWYLTMMVVLFSESYDRKIDLLKAIKIALVHDLAELYTGDVYAHDEQGRIGKEEREKEAAEKLFSLLPEDLKEEFHTLREEYEAKETEEAKFVWALDKLHPRLQYRLTQGDETDKMPLDKERDREKANAQDERLRNISPVIGYLLEKIYQEN